MRKLVLGFVIMLLASAWASAQFTQQGSKLVGAGAVGAADQGVPVAISADGSTAIVGGPYDNSYAGAAWVYVTNACTAPAITSQPQSQSIQSGQTATRPFVRHCTRPTPEDLLSPLLAPAPP